MVVSTAVVASAAPALSQADDAAAAFVIVPAGHAVLGRACPSCPSGRVMDDPSANLTDGQPYLSYDEMPPRVVAMPAFAIMAAPVAAEDWARSGLGGDVTDVSHDAAVQYAGWLSAQSPNDGSSYRLPTEAEWVRARAVAHSVSQHNLHFAGREHVLDWHGVTAHAPASPTGGPVTGMLTVVRDGAPPAVEANARAARYSVPPGVTRTSSALASTSHAAVVNASTFRLVRVPKGTPPLAFTSAPLSQTAVLPAGIATTPGGPVDTALLGPPASAPHFAVRMALPLPPDTSNDGTASLTGLDPSTMYETHSPGFEVLANGDVLAVWFSAADNNGEPGGEDDVNTRMVQARLRHGADRWDTPELFYDWKFSNDQSALLWTEGNRTWFFGGGGKPGRAPQFKVAYTDNSGASWAMHLPTITNSMAPSNLTTQPITTAFRGLDGALYFGVDVDGHSESGLWRTVDNGTSWADMHGRTLGRHTSFFIAKDKTKVFGFGGKNTNIDGYMPGTVSTDSGATFAFPGFKLPFPALGSNQRPCVHRLRSGNLVFVGDLQLRKSGYQPAGFTGPKTGITSGVYAALSTTDGATWTIKSLPIGLPHRSDLKDFGTLGYSTVRQAPNGVIHILSTMTHPCLHYEINEAWFHSDSTPTPLHIDPAAAAASVAVPVKAQQHTAPDGLASWSYVVDPVRGYLLDGDFVATFPGTTVPEYTAAYADGVRTAEALHDHSGRLLWRWNHAAGVNRSLFERWDAKGQLRARSEWDNQPIARDAHLIKSNPPRFRFTGLAAGGPACLWDAGGGLVAATWFTAGVVDNSTDAECH
jgi:hypothetical protein